MSPLVSIITPTYNHEQYISQCIESVLAQTFPDWEMIIVDDCSRDRTKAIAESYAAKDVRIRVLAHEWNYGPQKLYLTHNEALNAAQGKYITVLEGDDYWPEYRLELLVNAFRERNIVLAHGLSTSVADGIQSEIPNRYGNAIRSNKPVGNILKRFLLCENPIAAQSAMVRKDVLEKIGGFKQVSSLLLVDYPTWMEIALHGEFGFINRSLGFWRRHSLSLTGSRQEELWRGLIEYACQFGQQHGKYLSSIDKGLKRYIESCGYNAYVNLCRIKMLSGNYLEARQVFWNMIVKRWGGWMKCRDWGAAMLLVFSLYLNRKLYRTWLVEKVPGRTNGRRNHKIDRKYDKK